jgi:hypothetical protein
MAGKAAKGGLWFKTSQETEQFLRAEAVRQKRTLSNMIGIWMDMIASGESVVATQPKRSTRKARLDSSLSRRRINSSP